MIEGLQPYANRSGTQPTVRTSAMNIPWLDQIPANWRIIRAKGLFTARTERARPDDEQLSATQAYGVIPQKEFERRVGRKVVQITQHLDKRAHVEPDDFVISMRSFQGGLERAWARGCIRSSYVVLKPSREAQVGYFAHLFKSLDYIRALQATGNFIRDGQDLNFNNFSLVDLPLPPFDEQVAIARFLDHANRKIDGFIRAKRKLIGLLNEQKQAIIHRAVTRGLNPNAPLKPSGIPWLGDIPQHWDVRRLRTLVYRIEQGISPQATGFLADGDSWGVLKSGCVNHGVFRQTEHKQLAKGFTVDPAIIVKVGDVLISRACGSPKLVGSVGKVRAMDYKLILSDKTFRAVFRPLVNADFMVYAMNCSYYRQQVEQAISGAEGMANNLPLSELRSFVLVVPPFDEATAIASALDRELAQFNTAAARTEREIALMQEYRTRLTADVVTGKLDVRPAAASLPDLPADVDTADPLAEEASEEADTQDAES
jgi:type I restriction enzyme S subunit